MRDVDPVIQEILSDARHTPQVTRLFDNIEDSEQYRAAWEWAYVAASLAYKAGRRAAA